MKKRLLIALVFPLIVIFFLVPFANAEVQVKDFDSLKNTESFWTYILGVGVGISWANTWLNITGQPPLYCQPENLALGVNNYMRILQEQIERKYQKGIQVDSVVELYLLQGLMETFPCKK
jgi:hypothetical protein